MHTRTFAAIAVALALIVAAASLMLISGCGNMDIVDWHWTFDKALVKFGSEWREVDVKNWHDYDNSDMVAVETEDQVLVTHSCNVVLIKNKKN